MSDLISRASSDADIDSHNLRNALDMISSDLAVPFLEKRARSKTHKKNPLDELNAVIQELTGRERELQAAVGIAKMLLDRNDDLVQKRRKIVEKKRKYKHSVKHYQEEMEELKERIILSDEKYQDVNNALAKSEEDQLRMLAENKRILYENASRQEKNIKEPTESYEAELFEIKSRYEEQYDSIFSNNYLGIKQEQEKKIKSLEDSFTKSEKEKFALMETLSKLEKDQTKLTKKLKDQDDLSKQMSISSTSLEDKCRDLTILNVRLKAQTEKLQEDLKVYQQPSDSLTPKKPKVRRQFSLKSELESIEELEPDSSPVFHSYTLSRANHTHGKSLEVSLSECIAHITTKRPKEPTRRKDPSEEYFTLVIST